MTGRLWPVAARVVIPADETPQPTTRDLREVVAAVPEPIGGGPENGTPRETIDDAEAVPDTQRQTQETTP